VSEPDPRTLPTWVVEWCKEGKMEGERTGDYLTGEGVCVCHNCGHEMHGYADHELTQAPHGWVWFPIPNHDKAYFVMCGECVRGMQERRAVSRPWQAAT
jgi:hypothetical protein